MYLARRAHLWKAQVPKLIFSVELQILENAPDQAGCLPALVISGIYSVQSWLNLIWTALLMQVMYLVTLSVLIFLSVSARILVCLNVTILLPHNSFSLFDITLLL